MEEEKKPLTFELFTNWCMILIIFSIITTIGNIVGYNHPLNDSFIGLLILCGISLAGLILEKVIPYHIPSIIYISILGLILSVPWAPTSPTIIYYTSKVELLSITTILLAYGGIAMGNNWGEFKRIGLRGVIVTLFVIFGTYICSALIAQGVLMSTNMI
ncbi:MAG: hypothetical protein Q4Q23_07580 [Methanobacteriaceae archaeon]|nr:hypothetical protein [Methanobacteriaceae archaeon]